MTIRIVQVIGTHHPSFGGPSSGAIELNNAFRRQGAEARLMSGAYQFGTGRRYIPGAPEEVEDRSSYAASRPYTLMNSRGLRAALSEQVARADLVHVHGMYLLPNVYAYVAARRHRVAYGVQAHGTLEPYQRAQSRTRKAVYNALIGNKILARADYVHFAAASEAARASDVVPARQALIHPLGAALSSSVRRPRGLTRELPDPGEVTLFLGRLARKKRPDLLIEAWAAAARRPTDLLVLAGPEEDYTQVELAEMAHRFGCGDSVVFVGPVDAAEAAWLYRRSRTFVLASENENFAIAVAEAMLAEHYVITTRQVAASEHVHRSGDGVVLAEPSIPHLTAALTARLAGTRAPATRSATYAREHLSWDSMARSIIDRAIR